MQKERWFKLEVWKKADEMALMVYKATKSFPKEEIYGWKAQAMVPAFKRLFFAYQRSRIPAFGQLCS
jgi:hypothetical protein